MTTTCDILIVGAGPAGMAAAVALSRYDVDVLVIDDQPQAGGQIWRAIGANRSGPVADALGDHYRSGAKLADDFSRSGVRFEPGSRLWQIEPGWRAFMTTAGKAWTVTAKAIVLATGAQERPVPFPGWTLPGVMTVGAAQILLKTSAQIPDEPVWIAGSGPLPLLYMTQLLNLGGRIAGFIDTTPPAALRRALPHLAGVIQGRNDVLKGLKWQRALKRAGVPVNHQASELEAVGRDRVEIIRFRNGSGDTVTADASLLLVHEGVVPSIHTTLAIGCDHDWRGDQHCFVPRVDAWGRTSKDGIVVAGDGAGIAGADVATTRGRLAAIGLALDLGKITKEKADAESDALRRTLRRQSALRDFLDAWFRPRREILSPPDRTVACRCEEVTAGRIRATAQDFKGGPNQIKAHTRTGMGPCQGRQCGYTVMTILAESYKCTPEEVGLFRVRPPLKPVTLGELATLDSGEAVK